MQQEPYCSEGDQSAGKNCWQGRWLYSFPRAAETHCHKLVAYKNGNPFPKVLETRVWDHGAGSIGPLWRRWESPLGARLPASGVAGGPHGSCTAARHRRVCHAAARAGVLLCLVCQPPSSLLLSGHSHGIWSSLSRSELISFLDPKLHLFYK